MSKTDNSQPVEAMDTALRVTPVAVCCCPSCGNCTKAPTFMDTSVLGDRNCCCAVCGHCVKRPTVVQQFILPSSIGGLGRPADQNPYRYAPYAGSAEIWPGRTY